MKYWGSGADHRGLVHLEVRVEVRVGVGVGGSEEKNTDATTDLSSISMPGLGRRLLDDGLVFCRGALMEVWNRILSRLPSLARMPSAPRFQPAASRTGWPCPR